MDEIVRDEPLPGVRRLRLNRPAALNSLTFAMYESLIAELETARFDPACRVVVLTGSGRAFCAGHDIRSAGTPGWVAEGLGKAQTQRLVLDMLGRIPRLMRALPQPVICAVNGVAAGAGYALAVAADLTIAAASAKFVNAFHNAGTGHELGFSYLLPRLVGLQRAAELLYTGRPITAAEAAAAGLILRCVADEAIDGEVLALATEIIANSPLGIALTKDSLMRNVDAPSLDAAIELENRGIFMSQSSADAAERRAAFVEKRQPRFTGQ